MTHIKFRLYGRHMQANPEPPKKNNDKSKKISRLPTFLLLISQILWWLFREDGSIGSIITISKVTKIILMGESSGNLFLIDSNY
ncbi:hypothetical protein BTVI_59949 [Pitangus sulphuratus]|nr:hypothetical protein BTVI_59949 [Pitangus sulphuratus]